MNRTRVLSLTFAVTAAAIATAGAPASRRIPPLLADACTGDGKSCTHDHFCEVFCEDVCCYYGDTWTYYKPAE